MGKKSTQENPSRAPSYYNFTYFIPINPRKELEKTVKCKKGKESCVGIEIEISIRRGRQKKFKEDFSIKKESKKIIGKQIMNL